MSKFFLRIATPERDAFAGEVEYLSVNTPRGREGFMRGALSRIVAMSAGYLEITDGGKKNRLEVGDGLIYIENSGVTVITSECIGMDNRGCFDKNEYGELTPEIARAKIVSTINNKNSLGDR